MSQSLQALQKLKHQIQQSVIGQEHVIDALLVALLTKCNVFL
jgi:MoxR-like ATPase